MSENLISQGTANKFLTKLVNVFTIDLDKKRNYGLDILRALAIFFVLNVHSAHFFDTDSYLFKILTTLGLDGVSLFFVLSGFLIGRILINLIENKKATVNTLFGFWMRRWYRTLPNYFLILTILVLLGLFNKTITNFWDVVNYYFFLANLNKRMPGYLFPEAWSLSIEEWFYLLIPIFIFIGIRAARFKPKHSFLAVALSVIIAVTWYRYYRFSHMSHPTGEQIDAIFRKEVTSRLDSLMYGMIGAFLAYYHLFEWKRYKKLLFFIGIFLLYSGFLQYIFGYYKMVYICVFYYGVQSIGFLCLFPYLTELKSGEGLIYRIITRVSIISYSLYLLNYSLVKIYLIDFLTRHFFKNITGFYLASTQYFIFWFATILGSILLYKYFEKPCMALRDTIHK